MFIRRIRQVSNRNNNNKRIMITSKKQRSQTFFSDIKGNNKYARKFLMRRYGQDKECM